MIYNENVQWLTKFNNDYRSVVDLVLLLVKNAFDKQVGTLREKGSFSNFLKLDGYIMELEFQTTWVVAIDLLAAWACKLEHIGWDQHNDMIWFVDFVSKIAIPQWSPIFLICLLCLIAWVSSTRKTVDTHRTS